MLWNVQYLYQNNFNALDLIISVAETLTHFTINGLKNQWPGTFMKLNRKIKNLLFYVEIYLTIE